MEFKLTEVADKMTLSAETKIKAFDLAKQSLNESRLEYINEIDSVQSDELQDASIIKKRMKDKVMEVLTNGDI